MKMIRYSVIIPVYNGEKTLKRTLDSLLSQNRADVEILVISDGSTDGTDRIAEGYGKRIRFFRQEHAGVSAARNLGLWQARGQYVTFVDSDDFVTADYFAVLDQAPDCDLLVFGVHCPGGDPMEFLLKSRKIMSPCNKRIRRNLIEEQRLRFREELQVGEDFCFCFACALAAKSLECIPEDLYQTDISNVNSLSRRYRPDLDATMAEVFSYVGSLSGAARYERFLEELRLRQVLGCIAEEWKRGRPTGYRVAEICRRFCNPIGTPKGLPYRILTWLLRWRWYGALAGLAYLGKGRTFRTWRKKC